MNPGFLNLFMKKLATKAEFLDYLKQIETDADQSVIAAVKEVYGDNWLTPFREMYRVERERREKEREESKKT